MRKLDLPNPRRAARLASGALLTAALFCGAAGLIGQTSRDQYRQAYNVWQQVQANLERDAGNGGAPQVAQADRSASAAASFEATRAAYVKSASDDAIRRRSILQTPTTRSSPDLMPAAVASLAAGELLTVDKAIAKFTADKDPGIQQLRQSLERERVALVALSNTIQTRQATVAATSEASAALELARAKAAEAFGGQASLLARNAALTEMERVAWADYYSKLADAIQNANLPAPSPSPAPASPPTAAPPVDISTNAAPAASAPAPRSSSVSPVPLVRYVGEWTFPVVNGIFHGATPVSVALAVRENNGHAEGTLSGRFQPPAGVTDPLVQFTFEGEIAATPTQKFTLKGNDGRSGVIELIPGPAFNLLEVNFQMDLRPNKIRSGNFILVKK
jgi:hypothetical protein